MVTSRRGRTARGPCAPRRPRQGHRPRRPHRHRAAHVVAGIGGRGIRVDVVDTDRCGELEQPWTRMRGRRGLARAHGITGEVVVEIRTDDPGRPASRRVHAARQADPGGGPERDYVVDSAREHSGPAVGATSTGWPTATPLRRCGHPVRRRHRGPAADRGPRRVLRPSAGRPAGA